MTSPHPMLACVFPLALACFGAHAQADRSWNSIGAAGSVTPSQQASVEHVAHAARIPLAAANGVATLRYSLSAVDGLFVTFPQTSSFAVGMRFIDNGTAGRVQMALRSYDRTTGVTSTVQTLDSNAIAPSNAVQSTFKCVMHTFDFSNKAYYIEATLSKTAVAGRAQVSAVWVTPTTCIVAP